MLDLRTAEVTRGSRRSTGLGPARRTVLPEAPPIQAAPTLTTFLSGGVWVVADQALFASAHFGLNVLLARWLTAAEYGAFALAYSIFLLAATVFTAFVYEPMMIFGAGVHRERLGAYLAEVLRLHLRVTVGLGLVLTLLGGALLGSERGGALAWPLIAVGVTAPLVLVQWLYRKAFQLVGRPALGALWGVPYLGVVLMGAELLRREDALGPASALLLIGGASLLTCLGLALSFPVKLRRPRSTGLAANGLAATVRGQHREYGRWSLGTNALGLIPQEVWLLVLPLSGGLAATGAFRALTNFLVPVRHVALALTGFLLPQLAGGSDAGGRGRLKRQVLTLGLLGGAVYGVLLLVFRDPLLHGFYGGAYDAWRGAFLAMAVVPALDAVRRVLGAALKANGGVRGVFVSDLAGAGAALTAGVGLTLVWGPAGAMLGTALSLGAAIAVLAWRSRA